MNGLKYSSIPLGGFGAGTVEYRRDGFFHDWQIMNNFPLGGGPAFEGPAGFGSTGYFALNVKGLEEQGGKERVFSALLGPCPDNELNNGYDLPWLTYPDAIEAQAAFPLSQTIWRFNDLPLDIGLEHFTPFIPHNVKDSSLPGAFFDFTLRNRSERTLTVSLMAVLPNLSGYAHPYQDSMIRHESCRVYDRLYFGRDLEKGEAHPDWGEIALSAGGAGESSWMAHPLNQVNGRSWWEPLRESGRLENRDLGDYSGMVGNEGASHRAQLRKGTPQAALCRTLELAPGEEGEVRIILSWFFPFFRELEYKPKQASASCIGHFYNTLFSSVDQVASYMEDNGERLERETRLFSDTYYRSSLPEWLLNAASAQLAVMRKSSWYDERGRFAIWEGLGCCGLQTTDITHYGSFPIVQMFPELQISQMTLTKSNADVPGKIPHMMAGNLSCSDLDHRNRIDLIPQYALLVWRDWLWTGDNSYLRRMLPTVKESLDFFRNYDTDGDGLPNNTGPDQTYDQFPLKGTSAFVGYLYMAALAAAEEMAGAAGYKAWKSELARLRDELLPRIEGQLWNGSWFRLCHDPETGENNEGVMADQINGDWFFRQACGRMLLDREKAISALESIAEHCLMPEGYVANCAWPAGDGVTIGRHTANQGDWPWSGVEYALASHMILAGREDMGYAIARMVWDRYEKRGRRFNHTECGQYYYRALSSWTVYLSATGFVWNGLEKTLSIGSNRGTFFWATPQAWGSWTLEEDGTLTLNVERGILDLKALSIGSSKGNKKVLECGRIIKEGESFKGKG